MNKETLALQWVNLVNEDAWWAELGRIVTVKNMITECELEGMYCTY